MDLDNPKDLMNSTCSTNSEPYALQNLGNLMEPEFSENCIIIVDPGMKIHHQAYAVVEYQEELYFRQYVERGGKKYLICLNSISGSGGRIELAGEFSVRGCIIQQKQRKQKPLHYYHLNTTTKAMDFSIYGKEKAKDS